MTKPILMAVDDQIPDLETLQQELLKRYAADYEIVCEPLATSALQRLKLLQKAMMASGIAP